MTVLKRSRSKYQLIAIASLMVVVLSFASCAEQKSAAPPPAQDVQAEPAYMDHEIRYSGETLAYIAAWYTGKGFNWSAIQAANPGLNPGRLRIGQVVRIPEELLVRRDALPQSFLKRAVSVKPKEGEVAPSGETPAPVPSDGTAPAEPVAAEPAPVEPAQPSEAGSKPAEPAAPPVVEAPPVPPPAEKTPEDLEKEKLLDELLK